MVMSWNIPELSKLVGELNFWELKVEIYFPQQVFLHLSKTLL
jgi:hypothetical protein